MFHSIDAVARLTGISAFTLRNWEKRYEFLKPKRRENGFRAYDDAHVEMLRKVTALLSHGARIGDLAESIRKGKILPEVKASELAPEVEELGNRLYTSLVAFELHKAETTHAELESEFERPKMLDLIYGPLLSKARRDWNEGEISLAQKHFACAFIKLRIAPFLTEPPQKMANEAKKALFATTIGDHHEANLMLWAAHLKLNGWSSYYLGAHLPIEDVRSAAQLIRPKSVCLSFADKHEIQSQLKVLSSFECKVCIGGFGALTFDADESLPSHLHLFKSDARQAAEVIEAICE